MFKSFPKINLTWKSLGTSIVSLGLGLGSGEFILWPFLVVTNGFGVLWGAILGITIQLILILEVQRYTSVKGEDLVSGLFRINRIVPLLVLFFGVLGFGWPGFAASSSALLNETFKIPALLEGYLPILLLLLCAGVLLVGRNIYSKIEIVQTFIVIFSFLFVLLLLSSVFGLDIVNLETFSDLTVNSLLPKNIDLRVFLGAIAYAGTGGILLLSQSFYTIEEGLGMTKYVPKLTLWNSKKEVHIDVTPYENEDSLRNFRKLRFIQVVENTAFFWGLGLITILGLSYIAFSLLQGVEVNNHSLDFLILEAKTIGTLIDVTYEKVFLLIGVAALLSVQLGVYDITSRIAVSVFRHIKTDVTNGAIYSYAVLIQLFFGITIFLFGFKEPLWLIVTGAVINALTMSFISLCVVYLNNKVLPKSYRAGRWVNGILISAAIFYLVLFVLSFA